MMTSAGSRISNVNVVSQPPASVTVTVWIPAGNPLANESVSVLSDH